MKLVSYPYNLLLHLYIDPWNLSNFVLKDLIHLL